MASQKTFKGGVHPLARIHHGKPFTENLPIEQCSVPDEISLPLGQHIGAPAVPIVAVGDTVDMGQMVAKMGGFVSAPVFSSVSGTVVSIGPCAHVTGSECTAIVIKNDGQDRLSSDISGHSSPDTLSAEQIVGIIRDAGIVGLGGAAFPTHVKLSPPEEKPIDTLVINGAECEPYLTADHRIMLEHPQDVICGLKAVSKVLGVKKAYIAIEANKKNAIKAIEAAASREDIDVVTLKVKYPQGAEKQLIYAVTGRIVPAGKLPMDVGAVVVNASTAYQIAQAVTKGMPLLGRVVTVSGNVARPCNLMVRIGTPISHVIAFAGGLLENTEKIIAGGPMMGVTQQDQTSPIVKGTSGILLLSHKMARQLPESACIRCGKCVQVCPMGLQPFLIDAYVEQNDFETPETIGAQDCMECGCCSYICPAGRYLVQSIRLAKAEITASCKIPTIE